MRKVSDLADRGLCFIVYGQGGSGKTPLCAEVVNSPYASPMVDVDIEEGSKSITHLDRPDFRVVRTGRYQKVLDIIEQLKRDKCANFKAVMFDNMSELHLKIQKAVAGTTDQPTQPEWGEINRIFLDIVEKARELASETGMIVFLPCWDVDDKQDGGKVKKQLMFTPQVQNLLPGKVDVIAHLSVNPDQTRLLSFKQGPLTVSKFRRSMDSNEQKIPLEIRFDRKNNPFVDILDVIKGGKPWPASKYPNPQQQRAQQQGGNNRSGATVNSSETPEDEE